MRYAVCSKQCAVWKCGSVLVVKKCCLRSKKMKGEGTLSRTAGFIVQRVMMMTQSLMIMIQSSMMMIQKLDDDDTKAR